LPAPDGRYYGVHFWAYPLCGVPAKAYRRWAGRYEVGWPAPTNAALFALAIGVTLFAVRFPVGERLALAGLATAGPGWAYVDWPGSELFSWAFALIAVATFRDRRYGWSALGSGLAALQNPPVILFGGVAVLVALWEKRWRAAAGAVLGTAVGLIPYAFFYYHFGKPNLIAEEYARAAYISWCRTWGQLTDLNHGLLPYAPLLAFGFVFAAVRVALRRDLRELALLGATVAVAVATQVSRNWNSSCDGIQRYLVWLIPLVAGVIVCGFRNGRALWAFAALAVVFHSALVPIYREEKVVPDGYLGHTTMAKWVLTHCPELYWVESEVFIERTRHNEIFWPERTDGYPTGFVRPDGTVSKLILLPDCVERVPAAFEADEAYLAALRAEAAGRANSPGPYYVHPPRGALRAKAPPAR
jgi:hypothetical protein